MYLGRGEDMRFRVGSLLPPAARHPLRHSPLRLPVDDKERALRQQDRHLEHRHPHLLNPLRRHPILDQAGRRHPILDQAGRRHQQNRNSRLSKVDQEIFFPESGSAS